MLPRFNLVSSCTTRIFKKSFLFQALLEFLQRVVDNREKNKMTIMNVAMVMAPNLFMSHTLGLKSSEQREFAMAAGIANIMHLLIRYQKLLWTVSKYFSSSMNN